MLALLSAVRVYLQLCGLQRLFGGDWERAEKCLRFRAVRRLHFSCDGSRQGRKRASFVWSKGTDEGIGEGESLPENEGVFQPVVSDPVVREKRVLPLMRRLTMFKKTMVRGILAVALLASTVTVRAQTPNVFNMPTGDTSLQFVTVGNPGNAANPATGSLYKPFPTPTRWASTM